MKINIPVRFKNKVFWITFVPALFLVITTILSVFGINIDFGDLVNRILNVVEAIFALLAILGIAVDPTTYGLNDSKRAMTYTEPYKDEEGE